MRSVVIHLAACFFLAASAGAQQFEAPSPIPVERGAYVVAVADFNEDGDADLAVTNYRSGTVSVLLGTSGDSFETTSLLCAGAQPFPMVVADVDNDGHEDVLAADGGTSVSEASKLYVFFGDGRGGFPRRTSHDVGITPIALAAADLNLDGWIDVAVCNFYDDDLSILLNDGSGSLTAEQRVEIGTRPDAVVATDIDLDGDRDLVVACFETDGMLVVENRLSGGEGFVVGPQTGAGDGPSYLLAKHLNDDSVEDIVVYSALGSDVRLFLADGAGGFSNAATYGAARGAGPAYPSIAFADFDGDGVDDLAWSDPQSGCVGIRRGLGGVNFAASAMSFDAGPSPYGIAVSDFDGNGSPDIAAANYSETPSTVSVLLGGTVLANCMAGNVGGVGAEVLRINGSARDCARRRITISATDPLRIEMDVPPSRAGGSSRFALFGWAGEPSASTTRELPFGLGCSAMPTPLSPGGALLRPIEAWNNIGKPRFLGSSTLPSSPAPCTVLDLPGGLGFRATLFFQGFILDSAAPNGKAAVTNGIVLEVR